MSEQVISILLAEDDDNLSALLSEYLEIKGFAVTLCRNGSEALDKYKSGKFDLAVLDVMMPGKDGLQLAREMRIIHPSFPIIFLTAKSQREDKMEGFEAGADDYITKPFSMEELQARINAVLRRSRSNAEPEQSRFHFGKFEFDYNRQILKIQGDEQKLTTKETELLRLLCLHQNKVLSRETALVEIWGNDSYFTARSMDVFITKLRKYLKPDSDVQIINIHGTGYKLTVSEDY